MIALPGPGRAILFLFRIMHYTTVIYVRSNECFHLKKVTFLIAGITIILKSYLDYLLEVLRFEKVFSLHTFTRFR